MRAGDSSDAVMRMLRELHDGSYPDCKECQKVMALRSAVRGVIGEALDKSNGLSSMHLWLVTHRDMMCLLTSGRPDRVI